MSLQTPTTSEISVSILTQLESTLNQKIPLLPKAFNRVLAKVFGAVFIQLYKYGGFIFKNLFVQTASAKDTTIFGIVINPLKFWGRLIGVGDPEAATNAELLIDITVENQTGSLDSGSQLINAANGVTYITIGPTLLDAAIVQATIRAVSDQTGGGGAGVIGNLEPGLIVSFANPLANVARNAVVDSQIVTAANAEAIEVYRQRVIDRFQARPQGGAYADYRIWGEEVAGIVNIYPYTGDPGEVDVYAEATVASSGDPDGIPTGAQLQAVADAIELDESGLATRRPANALVNTLPITRQGFDTIITGLVADNLAQVQTDIESAIDEFFLEAEPFIDGLDVPPRKDRLTQSALIGLVEDITTAASGVFTTVTFDVTGGVGSLSLFVLSEGEKAKSTLVTFSP